MSNFRQISEKFWAGGQPSPEDLAQLARQGVKSIVNLRSPDETGSLSNEQELSKTNSLEYINLPLESNSSNGEKIDHLLTEIVDLPTPIYFHCGAGGRASVTALIALADQENWEDAVIVAKAIDLGIDPTHPQIHHYLTKIKQVSEPNLQV